MAETKVCQKNEEHVITFKTSLPPSAALQNGQAFATPSACKSHSRRREIERMATQILLAVEPCASQVQRL